MPALIGLVRLKKFITKSAPPTPELRHLDNMERQSSEHQSRLQAKTTEGHNKQLKLSLYNLRKKETSMSDFLSGHPDFDVSQLK